MIMRKVYWIDWQVLWDSFIDRRHIQVIHFGEESIDVVNNQQIIRRIDNLGDGMAVMHHLNGLIQLLAHFSNHINLVNVDLSGLRVNMNEMRNVIEEMNRDIIGFISLEELDF